MNDNTLDLLMNALAAVKAQQAGGTQYKHDASGTASTPYYTGPQGLFGVSQVPERDVISTRIQPRGLIASLPWYPANDDYPLYPYLTGFTDDSGSNPSTSCGTCKTPGTGKSCYQTAQFGRYCYDTRELDLRRVGRKIDRGDTFDYRFVNDPLARELASLFPGMPGSDNLLNGRESLARMVEVGIAFQLLLCGQTFTGDPANNVDDAYKEFPGLDILIGTNKVDALTNTDCPSLDSLIKTANYAKVDSAGFDVVNVFADIYRWIQHNGVHMGGGKVDLEIAMREELFWALTALWPCSYMTDGCTLIKNNADFTYSADASIQLRDDMRRNQYLLINAEKVPVVFDDCIPERHEADVAAIDPGCHASDVYFIPRRWAGREVTYMQYFDYSKGPMQAASDMHMSGSFWTDGGKYFWAPYQTKWCVKLGASIEPRLILLTPFLAARLTNLQYCVTQHMRDALPDDDYFVNGGVSTPRAAPSYYSDWTGR